MYAWICSKCRDFCHNEVPVCPTCLTRVPDIDWSGDEEEFGKDRMSERKIGVNMLIYTPVLERKPGTMDRLKEMGLDMDMDHATKKPSTLIVDAQWTPKPGENFSDLCMNVEKEIGLYAISIKRTYTELPPEERKDALYLQFLSTSGAPIMIADEEDVYEEEEE